MLKTLCDYLVCACNSCVEVALSGSVNACLLKDSLKRPSKSLLKHLERVCELIPAVPSFINKSKNRPR